MVTAVQAAGLAVTAALLAKLLERYAAEQALLLTLLLGILLTGAAAVSLSPVLNAVDLLLGQAGITQAETAALSKAIGICCVVQLASDICKDAGETALASGVMLAGKTALLLLTLPFVEPLLALLKEVLY